MTRSCLVCAGLRPAVHAEALKRLAGHRITAIVDPDEAAARRLARASGAEHIFASVQDALAADSFDRAHVLVPPDLHEPVASLLLQAGKPVLLEKPLAADAAQCASLLAAAQ